MEAMMADAARADRGRERRRAERRRREAKSKAAFGTMRRGFLNGPGPAKTKKKTQEKEKKREKREDEVAGSGGGQSSLFELDGEGNLVECGEEEVPTLRPKAGGAGNAETYCQAGARPCGAPCPQALYEATCHHSFEQDISGFTKHVAP